MQETKELKYNLKLERNAGGNKSEECTFPFPAQPGPQEGDWSFAQLERLEASPQTFGSSHLAPNPSDINTDIRIPVQSSQTSWEWGPCPHF